MGRVAGAVVVAGLGLVALGPAQGAETVPPACNPTVSGVGVPGCPSVLLGTVGDAEHPTIALPDLAPDVGNDVYVGYESIEFQPDGSLLYGPPQLYFDTYAQNLGDVPIQLTADDAGTISGTTVSQCVSWTTNLVCRQKQQVGGFEWHDEHKHYHFQDFAHYELRTLLADGSPDDSAAGLISSSPKVSFCLIDSLKVRDDASPLPRYNTCNPLEEGISPGWTDIYTSDLEGQMLSLGTHGDGRYALVVALDTSDHLLETNNANNRVIAIVEVSNLINHFPNAQVVERRAG
jgi:hypothetical protein